MTSSYLTLVVTAVTLIAIGTACCLSAWHLGRPATNAPLPRLPAGPRRLPLHRRRRVITDPSFGPAAHSAANPFARRAGYQTGLHTPIGDDTSHIYLRLTDPSEIAGYLHGLAARKQPTT
ncbi:MAG TPA: hypothetical protein DEQ61_19995 [Streptomyces sp.]|nr:hypothetical protein [Streptomyces sp.]